MNKKQSQSGNAHIVIIIVLVIGLLGALGYIFYQNFTAVPIDETPKVVALKTLLAGDFGDKGDYGTLQARGYVTTQAIEYMPGASGPYSCHNGGCVTNNYAYFNIVKTENTHLSAYLLNNHGNSYVQDNAIGIGCVEDGIISYSNISDENGMKTYNISSTDTTKILAATAEKPIDLSIEKLNFTGGGSGAPVCYSQFTTFNIINE